MFINIAPDFRIEVYYMNQEQCNNYNGYHGLREAAGDRIVTPGYYYERMNGPFATKQGAIEHAKSYYLA